MKTNRSILRLLALAVALGLGLGTAARAQSTWTGNTDGTWGTPANWSPSGVPASFANLVFPDVANQTIDVQADRFVGSLGFNAPDAYILNNNTLTVNGNITNNGSGPVTINSAIAIWNNFSFTGTGTGTVTVNGAISGTSKYINLNAPNYTLVLPANNTYSGGASVSAGTLLVTGTNSTAATFEVGSSGTLVLGSGSTTPLGTGNMQIDNGAWIVGADATTRTVGNTLSFQAGNPTTHNFGGPGDLVFTGSVVLGQSGWTRILNVQNTTTFTGSMSDAGAGSAAWLSKSGSGTLVLSGANTYNGGTTVSAGTLLVTGSNSSAAGAQVNSGATLALGSSSLSPLGSGAWNLLGGSWVDTADATTRTVTNSLVVTHNVTHNFAGPGALVLNGNWEIDFGYGTATMNVSNTVTLAGALSDGGAGSPGYLAKTGPGTLILAGNNSYNGWTYVTQGTLLATGSNSAPASAEIYNGAKLSLGGTSPTPLGTGTLYLDPGSAIATADATTRTLSSPVQFNAAGNGTYTFSGPGAVTLSSNVNFGAGYHADDLVVSNLVTISGNATDNGVNSPGIPRLQGPGTLVLSGSNSFSYVFYQYGGTLRLASPYALPGGLGVTGGTCGLYLYGGVVELAAGDLYRNYGGGSGATGVNVTFLGSSGFAAVGGNRIVNLGGASATDVWGAPYFVPNGSALLLGSATADSQLDFQNPINLNGAVREVRVDDNPNSATDQGKLSGQLSNGGLLKTGTGKLVLSANNTYAGATTVSAGTLVVNGTVGAGGLTINSGAHLGGSGTISSVIGGAGSVDPGNSPGILTVNQINPTGGLGFNFEFTNAGTAAAPGLPDYTNPLASRNDVLRITNAAPFTAALTGANIVDLYLASAPNSTNGFYGGFYTDAGNFAGQLTNATFLVYLLTPGGPVNYNGNQYNLVSDRLSYFAVHTVNQTGPGGVNGFVTEFDLTLVPEPSLLVLAGLGGWLIRRRIPSIRRERNPIV